MPNKRNAVGISIGIYFPIFLGVEEIKDNYAQKEKLQV